MKLTQEKQNVTIHGDFKKSSFATGDLGFLVDLLSDTAYTYKERAVIREYSCNALDSHTAAGNPEKIKVHLPTQFEQWFSVTDNGLGLSEEDVRTLFSGIGISDKRESNDLIGAMGIGTLSGFCRSDSFSVTSRYNGVVSHYTCYRDENRQPIVSLMSSYSTDEVNGVEVRVPASDIATYENEAIEVFKWWDELPDINSQYVIDACKEHKDSCAYQGEDWGVCPGSNTVAIMGNVAYNIPSKYDSIGGGYIKFNIGEIGFDIGYFKGAAALADQYCAICRVTGVAGFFLGSVATRFRAVQAIRAFPQQRSGALHGMGVVTVQA